MHTRQGTGGLPWLSWAGDTVSDCSGYILTRGMFLFEEGGHFLKQCLVIMALTG